MMMKQQSSSIVPSVARGLSILVVDSDTTCLLQLASQLEHYSYTVTTTELATVGLSMIRENHNRFKLVIASIDLLDMDPIAFLRRVISNRIPVIFVSSRNNVVFAQTALAEGASFFLQKPLMSEDIENIWQHAFKYYPNKEKNKDQSPLKRKRQFGDVEKGKTRLLWTPELHHRFTQAVSLLGDKKATPKNILHVMNMPHLTQRQIASHLQKYKAQVQKISDASSVTPPFTPLSSFNVYQQGINSFKSHLGCSLYAIPDRQSIKRKRESNESRSFGDPKPTSHDSLSEDDQRFSEWLCETLAEESEQGEPSQKRIDLK